MKMNTRPILISKDGYTPSCAISLSTITRKVVRDQTFVDQTDNLYHLNLPRDAAFESTESAYDLKEMHRIVNALPREYKSPRSPCMSPASNTAK